ncbi:MAG: class I SAM-dependent methyltransferase [Bacteroidaceae bacterium]|nr:class I SAM-dependent methyltransferase [Bacteroidaceae bacterium]
MEDYILSHITPEDPYLHNLYRATNLHLLRPRMASGHLQGLLLRTLTALVRPERVLEIGTFSGYATLCIASALPESGRIVTFEINDEQEDFTRPWFDGSPYAEKIEFVIGDVLNVLPRRTETFQMAYIDGNKRDYCAYYDLVLPRMEKGGLLLFDNTLWNGRVADEAHTDAQTQGIRRFNNLVAADNRVETLILPLRDGLTLLRKV